MDLDRADEPAVQVGVRVRLDRFMLDALDLDALQERVEPADGQGDAARARLRCVWLDEEPSVLVHLPEHLVADATVRGASEQARVPVDARVEIGHRHAGEEMGDPTRLTTSLHVSYSLHASSRSLIRPEGGVELIGRYRFVAQPAARSVLLLLLVVGSERKSGRRPAQPMA